MSKTTYQFRVDLDQVKTLAAEAEGIRGQLVGLKDMVTLEGRDTPGSCANFPYILNSLIEDYDALVRGGPEYRDGAAESTLRNAADKALALATLWPLSYDEGRDDVVLSRLEERIEDLHAVTRELYEELVGPQRAEREAFDTLTRITSPG